MLKLMSQYSLMKRPNPIMTRPFAASEWRCKMTKAHFEKRVNAAQNETHDALAEVLNNLNNGRQNNLLKKLRKSPPC